MKRSFLSITVLSVLFMLCTLSAVAQDSEPKITLSVKDQPIREIFRIIHTQTGLNVVVSEKIISGVKNITIDVKDMPVKQVLEKCFNNGDLSYSIVDGTIVIRKKQEKEIEIERNRNFQGQMVIKGYSKLENLYLRDVKKVDKIKVRFLTLVRYSRFRISQILCM